MSSKKYYVYIYRNPLKDNKPFYIGKGSGERYKHHLYNCILNNDSHKSRVINCIISQGYTPNVELIYCDTEEQSLSVEVNLIKMYGKILDGGTLVNNLDGGDTTPNNVGESHPKYGTGGFYKVTNTITNECFLVNALYYWAKTKGLNGTTLKEIAEKKVIKRTLLGNPVIRKQHKGYICEKV